MADPRDDLELNLLPARYFLRCGNKKKSQGVRSGWEQEKVTKRKVGWEQEKVTRRKVGVGTRKGHKA